MLNLDQEKFITDYVTTFLATWAANNYVRAGNEIGPKSECVSRFLLDAFEEANRQAV